MEKIETENDIDISILLATRGRPKFVQRLFKSLTDTAADSNAVEIILYIDDDMRELIRKGQPINAIRAYARKNNMLYLQEIGLQKVIEGVTSSIGKPELSPG